MLIDALIGAVTEAVIERVANIVGVEERLRQWLGRDPVRLAFRKAFTRVSTAFARQYLDLTASLFDEHFLTTHAAPELAKLLTRHQHPDPATLAGLIYLSPVVISRQAGYVGRKKGAGGNIGFRLLTS